MKLAFAALWVLAIAATGLLADAAPFNWFVLVASAIGPPLILLHYWNAPAQTMSESVRRVFR